jgi:phage-related protein
MAVFDWAESDGSDVGFKTRVNKVRYGDGYEQRAADGLNPVMQSWRLKFDDVDNAIGNDLIAFLIARGGVEAFDWTPKWATTAIKVICEDWNRSIARGDLSNISATFEQRFVP